MSYQIAGVAGPEEAALLAALESVRKSGGSGDNDDPKLAAEAALDRIARKNATGDKTVAAAYMDALATAEGAALYRVAKGESVVLDKAAALAHLRKLGA